MSYVVRAELSDGVEHYEHCWHYRMLGDVRSGFDDLAMAAMFPERLRDDDLFVVRVELVGPLRSSDPREAIATVMAGEGQRLDDATAGGTAIMRARASELVYRMIRTGRLSPPS